MDQFVKHDKFGIAFEYMLSIQLNFLVFGIMAPYIHENRRDIYAPVLEWKRHKPLHIFII
jgi:hypothetical protein